jgi:hypothetical protein
MANPTPKERVGAKNGELILRLPFLDEVRRPTGLKDLDSIDAWSLSAARCETEKVNSPTRLRMTVRRRRKRCVGLTGRHVVVPLASAVGGRRDGIRRPVLPP